MAARTRQPPRIVAPPPEEAPRTVRERRGREHRVIVVPTEPDERAAEALLAWLAAQLRP
jgi:hypothetical protein